MKTPIYRRIYLTKSKVICASFLLLMVIFNLSVRAEDPDYGNDPNSAYPIEPNGVIVEGILTTGDEDWFSFTAASEGLYEIMLNSPSNSKNIYVYGLDEWGDPEQITVFSASNGTTTKDVFIEQKYAGTCYLKVYSTSNTGLYRVSVLSPAPQCGDLNHPYPGGDANKDCIVNFVDVAILANNWLVDNRP